MFFYIIINRDEKLGIEKISLVEFVFNIELGIYNIFNEEEKIA